MARCTKKDNGKTGCTREDGHRGMCRIRPLDLPANDPEDLLPPADEAAHEATLPKRIDTTQARHDQEADARLALACELATALGLTKMAHQEGLVLVHPVNGRMIFLDRLGNLRQATLRIADPA